jgi:hypothetical protein
VKSLKQNLEDGSLQAGNSLFLWFESDMALLNAGFPETKDNWTTLPFFLHGSLGLFQMSSHPF